MTATIDWLHRVVVRPTLEFMAEETGTAGFASEGAQAVMLGIAAVESDLKYTRQIGDGPARSYFQCEPATAVDVIKRYSKKAAYREMIYAFRPTDVPDLGGARFNDQLRYDQSLACMCARLKLWDAPLALPEWHDVGGQEKYHKRFYNTFAGATEPGDYSTAFARHNIMTYLEGEFGAVET